MVVGATQAPPTHQVAGTDRREAVLHVVPGSSRSASRCNILATPGRHDRVEIEAGFRDGGRMVVNC
jgi:hypothetical protein